MNYKESETVEFKKSTVEIKEAVGNSLCHRDYSISKSNEVAIFKDRIEIYNPGFFPEEINPEDFFSGKEHSILRNPLIAETMYKSKDIERWGSGIKRIHDECVAAGVKVDFNRLKTGFVVVFYRPEREVGEVLEKGGQKGWSERVVRNLPRSNYPYWICLKKSLRAREKILQKSLASTNRQFRSGLIL